MEIQKPLETLQALANGVNPVTGELIPMDSPYNSPEIIRALFACLEQLKSQARRPKLSAQEKQADNVSKGLPRNAGMAWTDPIKLALQQDFDGGQTPVDLAHKYERTLGSIVHELKKQGLISEDEARDIN